MTGKENIHGETALMWASYHGHKDIVELLLKNGADVNARDDDGCTALIKASFRGHKEIVELLLKRGADVSMANKNGNTALIFASSWGHEEIVELLLKNGADVNAKNSEGNTALMCAMMSNHEKVVEMLLEHCTINNKKVILKRIVPTPTEKTSLSLGWTEGDTYGICSKILSTVFWSAFSSIVTVLIIRRYF